MTVTADRPKPAISGPRFDGQLMTLAQFAALPDDGYHYEYLKGVATVMSPAGGLHGELAVRLARLLGNYLYADDDDDADDRGHVYDSSTGYRMPNGDVRAPDVSVILAGRLLDESSPTAFIEIPPDVAVEIISPSERYEEVQRKIADYLNWGVKAIWIVEAPTRSVTVHTGAGISRYQDDETLHGGEAVPGFACPVEKLFP